MAVKLQQRHLPELLAWLNRHLPHSYKVHSGLRSHLGGEFPDLDFFVDRWPHPQATLALVDPDGQQLRCKAFYRHSVEGVYGVREEAVSTLLSDPAAVDWNTRTYFRSLPSSLRPVMTRTAQRMGRSVQFDSNVLVRATPSHLTPLPTPEGLKCRPVTSADIATVTSTWKHARDHSAAYIQDLIQRYPSLCLVTSPLGRQVGHFLGRSCDSVDVFFISPHFRGQDYGKIVTSQLL
ncbi:hypothetical protein ACOMHN_051654 [Nucella lapillus]